ncbi:GHMP kinase [Chloroflexota bacterium]
MTVRCKAPLRISFGGGGTDVSPYIEDKGGAVLNATIKQYAYCTISKREDKSVVIKSLDYDRLIKYDIDQDIRYDGQLDLVKATLKVMDVKDGVNIFLHCDAPPGSGLGTSSSLVVSIIGAIRQMLRLPLTEYDIAEYAYHIERNELGIAGGKQDQYAASFGNFNFIEFTRDMTIVNPLRINQDIIDELEYRLMLCYTGKTRLSAGIINDQIHSYIKSNKTVVDALDYSKKLATDMKRAILLGKIDDFGQLLNEAWTAKQKYSKKMTDNGIDKLYDTARKTGAIGGKLLGAGGGGYLLLLCDFDKRHVVAEELEKRGGKVTNVTFDYRGMSSWEIA